MEQEHLVNRQGFKIPLDKINESDKLQNTLVSKMISEAKALSAMHADFKRTCFSDINDFVAMLAKTYEVEIGGRQGGITLSSYDGKERVKLGIANDIAFGPEIIAAKELINAVVNEQLELLGDDAKLLIAIIQDTFETNNEGNFSKAKIMNLRSKHRLSNDSDEWANAMQALDDAIIVGSTKTYILFHERNDVGAWVQIPLVSKSL